MSDTFILDEEESVRWLYKMWRDGHNPNLQPHDFDDIGFWSSYGWNGEEHQMIKYLVLLGYITNLRYTRRLSGTSFNFRLTRYGKQTMNLFAL